LDKTARNEKDNLKHANKEKDREKNIPLVGQVYTQKGTEKLEKDLKKGWNLVQNLHSLDSCKTFDMKGT